jgi:hypothetical protein
VTILPTEPWSSMLPAASGPSTVGSIDPLGWCSTPPTSIEWATIVMLTKTRPAPCAMLATHSYLLSACGISSRRPARNTIMTATVTRVMRFLVSTFHPEGCRRT